MKKSLFNFMQALSIQGKQLQDRHYFRINLLFSLGVLIIAYFTYFNGYEYPPKLIWDEHFYLTDAQRYLSGVAFMEMHPPLGKQLIALGEWLFQTNALIDTSAFLGVERISSVPDGFSFQGLRFFPSLLSTLSALLFFWILVNISRRPFLSFLFSSLYLFENALIVQSRAAMLDGSQIFFALAALLFFVCRLNKQLEGKNNNLSHYFVFGLLIGLCSAVRYSGFILLLLIPFLLFVHWQTDSERLKQSPAKKYWILFLRSSSSLLGIALVLFLSFYIHFSLGKTVANNNFTISTPYLKIVNNAQQSELKSFVPMLIESLLFTRNYNNGVRRYNPYSPTEDGSLVSSWPFMNKPIRYLADRVANGETKYLYLHGNLLVWYAALFAIILSFSLLFVLYFFTEKINPQQDNNKNKQGYLLISSLTLLYFSYLVVLFNMDRVFYLYHYLLPLCFALLIFFTLFNKVFEHSLQSPNPVFYLLVFTFCAEIFFTYWYFSPITYYQPLSLEAFHQRQWMNAWNLSPLP